MSYTPPAKSVTGRIMGNAIEPVDDPTSRPAVPESDTPETDAVLLKYKGVHFEDEWKCTEAMYDLARSLERRLSLAQTEIKGHMRNEDDLKADYVRAREFIEQQSKRIAELEKDAARWRKGVSDGEFPIRRSGQWMHVSRTSGRILTGETPEEVIDAALKDRA